MERNILLTIAYDGTGFCGWQRQPAVRTVQGVLEEALTKVCRTEIRLNGTSRTDAGVHALGQRASFTADLGIPTDRLARAVNNLLSAGQTYRTKSSDVRILDAREMVKGFHARFDSKGKRYRYVIKNTPEADLFSRNYAYHVREPLDAAAMEAAAALIEGTHDFACFQSAGGTPRETTVRTVYSLQVTPKADGEIWIEIAGDGFLYNMVRIIAGTLTEVGLGRKSPADIPLILAAGNRQLAGHTAPAEGLYLVEVFYDKLSESEAAVYGEEDGQQNQLG